MLAILAGGLGISVLGGVGKTVKLTGSALMIIGGAVLSSWGSLQERDFLRKLWGEWRLRWPIMGSFKLQHLNLGNYFPYHHYCPTSSHHLSRFPRIHCFVAFIHLITVSLQLHFHLFAHCEDLIFNGCRRPAHCIHILFCSGLSLALSLFSNLVYFSQM